MVNLQGKRLKLATSDPHGVVSAETIMTFGQRAECIYAHYEGGAIVAGHLLGRLTGTVLKFLLYPSRR